MGVSSGPTTKTNSTMSGTSASSSSPELASFTKYGVEDYYGSLVGTKRNYLDEPNALKLGANPLQTQAATGAQNLGGWQPGLTQSSNLALSAAGTPVSKTTAFGYTAPTVGAGTGQATAAQLGPLATSDAAQAGVVKAGPAASLLDNFDAYRNVGTDDLVTSNLAAYDDNAGRNTAAFRAAAAKNGAFGSDRFGFAESQLAADQALGRGQLSAQLRYDAFDKQANLANLDAGRRQETTLFDAGQANDTARYNAGLTTHNNQFNAGQRNNFTTTQGGFDQQANLANADRQLQLATTNAGLQADQRKFNADAANTASMFNIGQEGQALERQLQAAGLLSNNANLFGNQARSDIGTQFDIGSGMREIDRTNQLAPLTAQQLYAELLNGGGMLDLTTGRSETGTTSGKETGTSKQSGGLLQQLLGAGAQLGSAAILASERRVKRDITPLYREADGLGRYRYNYVWDNDNAAPRFGVMVDEVRDLRPWALGPVRHGIQTVDYSKLEAA